MIALIEQNRDALVSLCRQFRVERLEIFGSAAKGTFQPNSSDLDFLVTFADARPGTYDRKIQRIPANRLASHAR